MKTLLVDIQGGRIGCVVVCKGAIVPVPFATLSDDPNGVLPAKHELGGSLPAAKQDDCPANRTPF